MIGKMVTSTATAEHAAPAFRRIVLGGLVVAALALSGCGRKNDLELPPDAKVEGQEKTLPPGKAPKKAPEKNFVLDWLL